MNGSQTLAFGGSASCGSTSLPLTGSGNTLTRTFATGTTRTTEAGVVVSLDTANASGYSTPVSGGMVISGTSGGHSITVDGIHLVATLGVRPSGITR